MGKQSRATQGKRNREKAQKERKQEKEERRVQRKEASGSDRADMRREGIDPDLVGIFPGPQPEHVIEDT